MEDSEDEGAAVSREGHHVHDDGGGDERHGQPDASRRPECAPPREVSGQKRQHEEAEVAQVEETEFPVFVCQADAEENGKLERHRRSDRQTDGDDRVLREPRWAVAGVGRDNELLPEPLGVFESELPRQGVEIAHAFHRHQECLVLGQTRIAQGADLVPEVVFELVDVAGTNCLSSQQVSAPLRDALL